MKTLKTLGLLLSLSILVLAFPLRAQSSKTNRLFIPGLDRASQSNVMVVFVGEGTCPLVFTNTLENTNLFAPGTRRLIYDAFLKYRNVTTNSGPPGTVLVGLDKTNYTVKALNRTFEGEDWIVHFLHTNSSAKEEIRIGRSISAKLRTETGDGYNVFFVPTGHGTMMRFSEVKHDQLNGVVAEFDDAHPQGTNWDFKSANFASPHLSEYWQYANGRVLGKFLMWNPLNGNLMIEAEFKEPYDWKKHVLQVPSR